METLYDADASFKIYNSKDGKVKVKVLNDSQVSLATKKLKTMYDDGIIEKLDQLKYLTCGVPDDDDFKFFTGDIISGGRYNCQFFEKIQRKSNDNVQMTKLQNNFQKRVEWAHTKVTNLQGNIMSLR